MSQFVKQRLDQDLVRRGLVPTRSQAESFIKLGAVIVNGKVTTKPGTMVSDADLVQLTTTEQYVSRAGLKLASVAGLLKLDFNNKLVLDVGSSTGGFTDYALRHGAKKVIAVDVGSDQLHPSLRTDPRVELHEKTDIRTFTPDEHLDITVMDVSFISAREILPHVAAISNEATEIVVMVKPQFEAGKNQVNKGVIKNDKIRREILKDFEVWSQKLFVIIDKADSDVHGAKGNRERFYLLRHSG